MKGLYFNPAYYPIWSGVTKKVNGQIKAFRALGCDISLAEITPEGNNKLLLKLDGKTLNHTSKGYKSLFSNYLTIFDTLIEEIKTTPPDFIYFRYRLMTPAIMRFIRKAKRFGIKIITEIPTYPYDGETKLRPATILDRILRQHVAKYFDHIVTFSAHSTIWNIPTINISNGIDTSVIPAKIISDPNPDTFTILAVAQLFPWHGIDRVITGIARYYRTGGTKNVQFHIVGKGSTTIVTQLQDLILTHNLQSHIHLHGPKTGLELDHFFNISDFAIGSLGRHRSNITHLHALKNIEYATRGIPFTYSEIDTDFDQMPYVLKASPDESPLDIQSCIDFYSTLKLTPLQIRSTAFKYDWTKQISPILQTIHQLTLQ